MLSVYLDFPKIFHLSNEALDFILNIEILTLGGCV